ncbi:MAG: DUF1361 domain-containing protein [Acholeplasmataceae bacterium]|nr:DUF1361 domain-containing protein [Acholeplasmataceae bacterium]
MIFKKIHIFYYLTFLYMIISVVLGFILSNGLVIFLGWNIFLATIVFLLAEIYVHFRREKSKPIFLTVILILYVLFFPNTIYVLTDFIHLENYHFFSQYPDMYAMIISDWLVFMHITIGALYAAKLGIASLNKLELHQSMQFKKYKYLILSSLFFLSSLGIFIGRFLRFNSWQIFDFFSILSGIFSHVEFALVFILIFFILHWVSYFIFSQKDKISL